MTRDSCEAVGNTARDLFLSGFYCAESVLLAVARAQGVDSGLLPGIATAFCSGQARTCGPCGALSGALMAVGLLLGRSAASDSVEPAYAAAQALVEEFEREFGARDCRSLLDGCDLGTPGGQKMFRERELVRRCHHFTARAAEMAVRIVAEHRP
jgi:C_GCAxxG_C_C family probable redox protein